MAIAKYLRNSMKKCKTALMNPTVLFEFQTNTLKLIGYNYVLVLLIANQDVPWNYAFRDAEISKRIDHEVKDPTNLSKFGIFFRILTIILNTLPIYTILDTRRENGKFLLLCILWNFYTITAVAENILEIVWTMFILEVNLIVFASILMVGVFMVAFHSKLALKSLRFYDYLNYI